jgi:hypothetical protein
MAWKRTCTYAFVGLASAALLVTPALGGKPPVTAVCVLSGDVQSIDEGGELVAVEIGVSTTAWELIDPATGAKTTLWLQGNVLAGAGLYANHYFGQARVLKKDGRFDFDFDTAPCVSPVYGDKPPYGFPYNDLCRYLLIIEDGVYYRGADEVVWSTTAGFSLVDYGLGVPCAVDPDDPDCIEPGEYIVGSGTLASQTAAQFGTSGGEEPPPEPEPTPERSEAACTDGVDNDGDGLIDRDDPNCKKWYR